MDETTSIGGDPSPMRAVERAGLALFLLAIAVLQLPVMRRRGFWLDEAFSVAATTGLGRQLRETAGTMATFYVMLVPWRAVSTDRTWMRLLPLLFALAALALLYQQARRLLGREVAVVAIAFTASTHLFLRWSTELRSYSMALLLVVIGWFAVIRWVHEEAGAPQSRWRWIWGAAGAIGVLTHGLTAFHVLFQLAAVAAHPNRRHLLRWAWPGGAGLVLAGGLWLAGASESGGLEPFAPNLVVRMWVGFTSTYLSLRVVRTLLLGSAIVVGALRWGRDRSAEAWPILAVLLWAIGAPLLALIISPARAYLRPAYHLAALPGLALLVGMLVADPRWRRRTLPVALALFALLGSVAYLRTSGDEGDRWRDAAEHVAASVEPGDVLVVPSGYRRSPFDLGWEEAARPPSSEVLVPLFPEEPIGEVRRFYDSRTDDLGALVVDADPPRVIVVEQPSFAGEDLLGDLLDDPRINANYRATDRADFEIGISVVILERR